MKKPRVYVETSVVSYLTARPARDIVIAGRQQSTQDWWAGAKEWFESGTSRTPRRGHGIEAVCRDAGIDPPLVCTPEQARRARPACSAFQL